MRFVPGPAPRGRGAKPVFSVRPPRHRRDDPVPRAHRPLREHPLAGRAGVSGADLRHARDPRPVRDHAPRLGADPRAGCGMVQPQGQTPWGAGASAAVHGRGSDRLAPPLRGDRLRGAAVARPEPQARASRRRARAGLRHRGAGLRYGTADAPLFHGGPRPALDAAAPRSQPGRGRQHPDHGVHLRRPRAPGGLQHANEPGGRREPHRRSGRQDPHPGLRPRASADGRLPPPPPARGRRDTADTDLRRPPLSRRQWTAP